MSDLYAIKMSARMYYALREREAMVSQNPVDQAARAVFMKAEPRTVGRGHTYVITGEKDIIHYILDYLDSLLGLSVEGIVPAYEFGCDIKTLRRVAGQRAERVAVEVPRETSEGEAAP